MDKERTVLRLTVLLILAHLFGCAEPVSPVEQEISKLYELQQQDETYAMLFERFGDPPMLFRKYQEGVRKASEEWERQQSHLQILTDFGTTEKLQVLPIIDWHVAEETLKGESAVAYLVKTDESTILFDLGRNGEDQDPSPLLHNMRQLGVEIQDIDYVIISHPHSDHTGGSKWAKRQTFSLGVDQVDLGNIRAFTPVPMDYPGIAVEFSEEPTVIAPGVATTGVITNYFFFMGATPEQALAVNVRGKGIVVISGCGHQTLEKIVDRAEALFDAPLYGLLGGLHYPITKCRNIDTHRYVGTGKLPGEFLTMRDVQRSIDYLKGRGVGLVSLSPHDSCDASVQAFRESFGPAYRDMIVGQTISVSSSGVM